jgi:hypothetical protein
MRHTVRLHGLEALEQDQRLYKVVACGVAVAHRLDVSDHVVKELVVLLRKGGKRRTQK